MDCTVRKGNPKDNAEVENVTREAFWNLYAPGCDEHYVIHKIWSHKDFIPELYFVAVAEGKIAGVIVFTVSSVVNARGDRLSTATFGPVCVLPVFQHAGIGARLIETGIEAAGEMGFPAVIILGDPHNYCKHGFKNSKDYAISDSEGRFPLGQLVRMIDASKFNNQTWKFFYSDVYGTDADETTAFDRNFPEKDKLEKSSQDLFRMLIRAYLI